MADKNDLTGPYQEHVDLHDMSKEFLVGLLGIWSNSYASINKGLFGALLKRMPIEEAAQVIVETFTPMYKDNMPLLTKLSGIEPKTVQDLHSIARLSLDGDLIVGDRAPFKSEATWSDANHQHAKVHSCPYLEGMEMIGAPAHMMNTVCFDVEEPLLELVYQQDNPAMPRVDIDLLKAGARKSKKELCCEWKFKAHDPNVKRPVVKILDEKYPAHVATREANKAANASKA
ncbi:MAG: hypothetical protein RBS02_16045 [Steroidobacteraceae bacterium]|jgi:hypothetical protein|nr:hypothetical protein [Steroidobacteraceae bacterium]